MQCPNLASKVLSLALTRWPADWRARYGVRPQLVETFVDRARFTGRCFSAANWLRVGVSTGRGRLGPATAVKSLKDISLASLLRPHSQMTQSRMAAEPLVLLPQDTTGLNDTGLRKTTGLGPLGEAKGQGLWWHSLLAFRPDGVPLGVLDAPCRARPPATATERGRNAKSIDEKESFRWLETFQQAAAAARPRWKFGGPRSPSRPRPSAARKAGRP